MVYFCNFFLLKAKETLKLNALKIKYYNLDGRAAQYACDALRSVHIRNTLELYLPPNHH